MGNRCVAPVCLLCSVRFLKLSVESGAEDACFSRPSTARIEHFKKERFNGENILTAALHYNALGCYFFSIVISFSIGPKAILAFEFVSVQRKNCCSIGVIRFFKEL